MSNLYKIHVYVIIMTIAFIGAYNWDCTRTQGLALIPVMGMLPITLAVCLFNIANFAWRLNWRKIEDQDMFAKMVVVGTSLAIILKGFVRPWYPEEFFRAAVALWFASIFYFGKAWYLVGIQLAALWMVLDIFTT